MKIPGTTRVIERIVVFIHPGQLSIGNFYFVTVAEGDLGFEDTLERFKNAICVYDGPPSSQTSPETTLGDGI